MSKGVSEFHYSSHTGVDVLLLLGWTLALLGFWLTSGATVALIMFSLIRGLS